MHTVEGRHHRNPLCDKLGTRYGFTGSTRYRFLVWNLLLAWLPYGIAVGILYLSPDSERRDGSCRERRRFQPWMILLGVSWLLTLPNGPYILTDVVHLMNGKRPFRWWFDAGLVLSFAMTGCFLAVASMRIMHDRVRRRSNELMGWAFVLAVSILCGLGIYLGRFLRFNSWDVLTEPSRVFWAVAVRVSDPVGHPQTCGVTLMFAGLLFACYAMFVPPRAAGMTCERVAAIPSVDDSG
ncbi:MAG TPA: DUF1361 domain-containing protein [Tepidisphaeraceae bacterium]|nr:DUF1361 domain-containing protein [Tepidisphaeraceae bacterium]